MNKPLYYLGILFLYAFPSTDLTSQIIINEVYADVAVSLIGDANGDGIRSAREDEFIELFNNDSLPVNISGFQVIIDQTIKHKFDDGLIHATENFFGDIWWWYIQMDYLVKVLFY